jgi:hypothetical protein
MCDGLEKSRFFVDINRFGNDISRAVFMHLERVWIGGGKIPFPTLLLCRSVIECRCRAVKPVAYVQAYQLPS